MTTLKFDKFVYELENLCKKHEVMLSPTMYDGLQVWNAENRDMMIDRLNHINFPTIEDKTALDE